MTKKRLFSLFITCIFAVHVSLAQKVEQAYLMKTVVIDAGHGGNDPGNLGTGRYKLKEKDIALDVALRVGRFINSVFPEIKVVYTRDKDVFIGLNERADVANKSDADLFLSIHCNAAKNPEAFGVETFALGLHRNDENLQVAMKENQAIFLEDDYEKKYEGFDPNSPESIIALTIMQSAFLEQSLRISSYIQNQFKDKVGRRDRGVKQAGFLVLRRTTMPSILIELGFLTNKGEEDFLNSENGRVVMASAIFRGFTEYKERVEGASSATKPAAPKQPQPEVVTAPASKVEMPEVVKVEPEKPKAVEPAKPKEPTAAEIEKARKQKELENAKAEKERLEKLKLDQNLAAQKKAREDQKRKDEADRLTKEKQEKEQQLLDAKVTAEQKEQAEKADRIKREAVAEQVRVEFAERLANREKVKQDSLQKVHAEQREKRMNEEKPATTQTVLLEKKEVVPQLGSKPLTADEAELLFLEKRKLELEERIARINKGKDEPSSVATQLPKENAKTAQQENQPKLTETKPAEDKAKLEPTKPTQLPVVEKGIVLSIQITTSPTRLDVNSPRFKGQTVKEYAQDGLFKYTVGSLTTFAAASAEQTRLRKLGFEGAFVVAFKDGERIKVDEARAILK